MEGQGLRRKNLAVFAPKRCDARGAGQVRHQSGAMFDSPSPRNTIARVARLPGKILESVASDNSPLEFAAVLEAEHAAGCLPAGESSGLAFSGGGIRSATFNLGVIQALAELRLLRRFD